MERTEHIEAALLRAQQLRAAHFTEGYFDHNGHLRAKQMATHHLERALRAGVALHTAVFTTDPANRIIPDVIFSDPAYGFPDATLKLDPASIRESHLAGHPQLLLVGDLEPPHDVFCVRAQLGKAVARLAALGFEARVAFEFECRMLREDRASLSARRADEVRFASGFEWFYSVVDQSAGHPLLEDLLTTLEAMNIPVDSLHTEYTDLLEVSLRPASALEAADRAGLMKAVTKVVARRHDLLASFMAMLRSQAQGCGAHINLSLVDAAGSPAFHNSRDPAALPPVLLHFIGGLQRWLPELMLLLAPNLNSFRRFQPGLFTPLTNTWAINNKTVAFRVVNSSPESARIECRLAGADVNPHLALLAILACGCRGIAEACQPTTAVVGDGWVQEEPTVPTFPDGFDAAIERFEQSSFARELFDPAFIACFVAGRRWQLRSLAQTVTDWEIQTFAEGA